MILFKTYILTGIYTKQYMNKDTRNALLAIGLFVGVVTLAVVAKKRGWFSGIRSTRTMFHGGAESSGFNPISATKLSNPNIAQVVGDVFG